MKRVFYIMVSLLVIGALVFGGIYLNKKSIDTAYNYAITLIQNGSYEGALKELEKANPNLLDRKEFKDDVKYHKLSEVYKNTVPLYAYALAQIEYNSESEYLAYMPAVNSYLELIAKDYNGELCEEIKTFKENFKPQYEEYLAERKHLDEELMRKAAESERQFYAKLRTKIPYEGMSESDINKTIMGNYHEIDTSSKYGYTKYYWRTNYGEIMLIVTCKDRKVTSVSRYGWGYFWTEDIKPIWNGTNPYKNKKSRSSRKKSDSYDVNEYSDPEDFYYDNYDDFWDYEEAEDYYNSYHEDP